MEKKCSFEGCPKPVRTRGWCNGHYLQQWSGKPMMPLKNVHPETCTLDFCDRPYRSNGLCEGHYYQARRGRPLKPLRITRHHQPVPPCTVVGCDIEAVSHDRPMCAKHEMRVIRHGDPNTLKWNIRKGADNPNWGGDSVGYGAVHERLRNYRGPASAHLCVDCDGPAAHWAYDYECPDERDSPSGPYSTSMDHYRPMCATCHKRFDNFKSGRLSAVG
ncbi:HNH endonuclease [Mycobacterium phage Ruotula]|uniref:HNH endonuclease n=1 Tax=Mycobacterium phage Abrogate TaxID=1551710 RepID=UPI00051AA655|nr:HNH endonuclease [Mycobacterium phage Abrogate]AIT13145.1 HNH endonuclease [Mycobacterium phage Abrogate]AVJ51261.1 HNH endonuclease [Mycobacterium phage Ruotula]QGH75628.1 HNH endonuclease [Mycobacterium phage DreamCatcher]